MSNDTITFTGLSGGDVTNGGTQDRKLVEAGWTREEWGGDGYFIFEGAHGHTQAKIGDWVSCAKWDNAPMMVRTVRTETNIDAGKETIYVGLISRLRLMELETLQFSVGEPPDPHSKVFGTGGQEYPNADVNWVVTDGETFYNEGEEVYDPSNGATYITPPSWTSVNGIDYAYVDREAALEHVISAGSGAPAGMRRWQTNGCNLNYSGSGKLSVRAFSFAVGTTRLHILQKLVSTISSNARVVEGDGVIAIQSGSSGGVSLSTSQYYSCSLGEEFTYPNHGTAYWLRGDTSEDDPPTFDASASSTDHKSGYQIPVTYYAGTDGATDSDASEEGGDAINNMLNRAYARAATGWVKAKGDVNAVIGKTATLTTPYDEEISGTITKVTHHIDTHEHYTMIHIGSSDPRMTIWGADTAVASLWDVGRNPNRVPARPIGEIFEAAAKGLGASRVQADTGENEEGTHLSPPDDGGGNSYYTQTGLRGWVRSSSPQTCGGAVHFGGNGWTEPTNQPSNTYWMKGIVDPDDPYKIWVTPGAVVGPVTRACFRGLGSYDVLWSETGSWATEGAGLQTYGYVTGSGDVVFCTGGPSISA